MLTKEELFTIFERADMGVSQTRLARDFGVTQGAISQILNGTYSGKHLRMDAQFKLTANYIRHRVRLGGITLPQMATWLTRRYGTEGALRRWLQRHAEQLAESAQVIFVVGKGRTPSYWESNERTH